MFTPELPELEFPPIEPIWRQRLGDYELEEEVGRGGMGIVFRARQVSLGRVVALKLLRDGPRAAAVDVQRFQTEATALAVLQHPNIVALHEVGVEDGQHFFVMEWLPGPSLATLTQAGPVPAREAARWVEQVAVAIQHAHERGHLHRDLKPSNVLLDAAGHPKVTDFGLAFALDGDGRRTLTGRWAGTPGYMAPEQAAGLPGAIGPSVDVYGLGALLFHLLTGRAPFVGQSELEVLQRVASEQPVSPAWLNPVVSPDLAAVCLKCLEKSPRRRYASAGEVGEDLRRWMEGEPTLARPVTAVGWLWRWARRKPALAAAITLAVAGLGATSVVSTLGSMRLRHEVAATASARADVLEKLWQSSLHQARAERLSAQLGGRRRALEALATAARIRPAPELQQEAIAALSTVDLEEEHRLPSHPESVTTVFHPRLEAYGERLSNGEVVFRELPGGRERSRLPLGRSAISGLVFSPDGTRVAVQFADGRLELWDWARGDWQWAEDVPVQPGAMAAAFHPHAPRLALRTSDAELRWVALESGAELGRLPMPWVPMRMVFLAGGDRMAVTDGRRCAVVDARSGAVLRERSGVGHVTALAGHPDGVQIALGTDSGAITLWNSENGVEATWLGEPQWVAELSFDPSGLRLASAHWNTIGQIWDVASGRPVLVEHDLQPMQFSPDGSRLACLRGTGHIWMARVVQPSHLRRLLHPLTTGGVYSVVFDPSGRRLAESAAEGLRLRDVDTGRRLAERAWDRHRGPIGFTADGSTILGTDHERFWSFALLTNAETGAVRIGDMRLLDDLPRRPLRPETDRDFATLFPSSHKGHLRKAQLRLIDRQAPEQLLFWDLPLDGSYAMAGGTNWLIQGGVGGPVIYGLGGAARALATNRVATVVVASPDHRYLANFRRGGIGMYELDTGRQLWEQAHETAATIYPEFTADGRTLVTGGTASPRVWLIDAATGRERAVLTPPGSAVVAGLSVSGDGRRLATVQGNEILVWDLLGLSEQLEAMGLQGLGLAAEVGGARLDRSAWGP